MSRQARSLDVLLAEVNAAAPDRSKASDGGLGDQAHASRASDHNPNAAGVWRARDFTNDPPHLDGATFADAVAARLGKHPALGSGAYVIWNRRIFSTDRLAEGWRYYSGSNPHNHHVHVSVATAAAGYDSTAPWGVMEDDDMANYADQLDRIESAQKATAERMEELAKAETKRDRQSWRREAALAAEVKRLGGDVDAILAKVTG